MDTQEAVQRLLAAQAEAEAQKAIAERLRDQLYQVARERYATDGTIQRWQDPALGEVRFDGAGKAPTIAVTKPEEFADFLAQRAPGAVRALVEVPADELEAVLAACEFAGVSVTARVETVADRAKDWLAEHAKPVAVESGWTVQELAEGPDGAPVVVTPDIPGLTAVQSQPRLVVRVATAVKADMVTRALAGLDDDLTVTAPPAEPSRVEEAPSRFLEDCTVPELRELARTKGQRTAGNKADLVARLAGVL
jgi:hypothetical protein